MTDAGSWESRPLPERDGDGSDPGAGEAAPRGWPVDLSGVTETVVATPGPDGGWAVAALGVHAPGEASDRATARTWGRTRTRRNLERAGRGVVQFTRDPLLFVDAALGAVTTDDPILGAADAWVEVAVERTDVGSTDGTAWADWALTPERSGVERRVVATTDRGYAAVVEATVAVSRFGVEGYDQAALRERLAYFDDVARRCGGSRVVDAMDRLQALRADQ